MTKRSHSQVINDYELRVLVGFVSGSGFQFMLSQLKSLLAGFFNQENLLDEMLLLNPQRCR